MLIEAVSDKITDKDIPETFKIQVMQDSKYDKISTEEVAQKQHYLTPNQCTESANHLAPHKTLFNGKLSKYKGEKINLKLKQGIVPRYF